MPQMKMTRDNVTRYATKKGYHLTGISGNYTLIHPNGEHSYHQQLTEAFDEIQKPLIAKAERKFCVTGEACSTRQDCNCVNCKEYQKSL